MVARIKQGRESPKKLLSAALLHVVLWSMLMNTHLPAFFKSCAAVRSW